MYSTNKEQLTWDMQKNKYFPCNRACRIYLRDEESNQPQFYIMKCAILVVCINK